MFKRILLTGSSGFVGPYVMKQLPCIPLEDSNGRIDLKDRKRLISGIQDIEPDAVIHLAAQSFIPEAFSNPRSTLEDNFIGTFNLIEALTLAGFNGRMLYVSSADVYGVVNDDQLPATELMLLHPRNPYAVSKIAAEALCYQWSQTGPFEVVIARPFNHIGKGQSRRFSLSDFAWQLIQISQKKIPPKINVGDIDVTRDFTDIHDVVSAYKQLLFLGDNGEVYNVCSGKEYSIRSMIEKMKTISGIDAEIVQQDDRLRRSEQRRMWGSLSKIHKKLGWKPEVMIEESLYSLLEGWEESNE